MAELQPTMEKSDNKVPVWRTFLYYTGGRLSLVNMTLVAISIHAIMALNFE
jgi:hypothetical protein